MQKITDNLYQINLGPVNVFVIEDNGLTLIDSGHKGSTDKIFGAIRKAGKNVNDIKQLILTHSHPDHAGSAAEIKRRLKIPVLAHKADAELMKKGIAGRLPHNVSTDIANRIIFHLFIKNSENKIEALEVDTKLEGNEVLPIAGGLQVVHTPGHSAGHIALFLKKQDLLIAGDICAHMMWLGFSTVYEDRTLGIKSILKAADLGFESAVFGHGRPIKHSAAKKMREKFQNCLP
ncbi:MAG: MBL fold metallo-hydrolase [Bacteroidota bacterium]